MIISVDTETVGLNCQAYTTGCNATETETFTYRNKKELWKKILNLGATCKRSGKLLTVLAHTAEYDFYAYADLTQKDIIIYNDMPFIATLKNKDYNIKFIDTYGIFRMKLKKAAKLIGMNKIEPPDTLQLPWEYLTEKEKEKIETYCERDAIICLQLYKEALKEATTHLKIKQVYTIYQLAIATIMHELKNMSGTESLLWNKKYGCMRQTNHPKLCHGAYRGGRVQAFKIGKQLPKPLYLDVNSLYPYALKNIKLPDLRTERHLKDPLSFMDTEELLEDIGVSRALIYNNSKKLEYLPIRGEDESIYPVRGQYFIGTYTHLELKVAIERGYEVLAVEQSVIWDEGTNHFRKIVDKYYKLRKKDKNPLKNYFYKQYLNGSIGKFAQTTHGNDIVIGEEKDVNKYLKKGYEIINDYGENLIFKKDRDTTKRKRYYAPIISALVTAKARTMMQEHYDKIPKEDLYYTDTDSIICHQRWEHLFDIHPDKLGMLKEEQREETITIYGKKTYRIGEKIKLSGYRNENITVENFEEGKVTNKKMIGLRKAQNLSEVGTFIEIETDLNEQAQKHKEIRREYEKENILWDIDIENITFFLPQIEKLFSENSEVEYTSPQSI